MNDSKRGTGRTERGIELAISGLLMGKTVVHVSGNSQQAKVASRYAATWLMRNGWYEQQVCPLREAPQSFIFGRGELRFVGAEQNLAGMRIKLLVEDHWAVELREEREQRQKLAAELDEDQETIKRLLRKHGFNSVDLPKTGSGATWHIARRERQLCPML